MTTATCCLAAMPRNPTITCAASRISVRLCAAVTISVTPGPGLHLGCVTTVQMFARSDAAQLGELAARVDAGDLQIHVAQRRPLADLPAVHDQAAAGELPGKTILIP